MTSDRPHAVAALRALQTYYTLHQRWPHSQEWAQWQRQHPSLPTVSQIAKAWHSWLQALAAAGAPLDLLITAHSLNRVDRRRIPQHLAQVPWHTFPADVRPQATPTTGLPTTENAFGPQERCALATTTLLIWQHRSRSQQWTWLQESPHPLKDTAWHRRHPGLWQTHLLRSLRHHPLDWSTYLLDHGLRNILATSRTQWPRLAEALRIWTNAEWPSAFIYWIALARAITPAEEEALIAWLDRHPKFPPPSPPRRPGRPAHRWHIHQPMPIKEATASPRGSHRRPLLLVVGNPGHRGRFQRIAQQEFGCQVRYYEGQDQHCPKTLPNADGIILALNQTSHEFYDQMTTTFAHKPSGFLQVIAAGGSQRFRNACQAWATYFAQSTENGKEITPHALSQG